MRYSVFGRQATFTAPVCLCVCISRESTCNLEEYCFAITSFCVTLMRDMDVLETHLCEVIIISKGQGLSVTVSSDSFTTRSVGLAVASWLIKFQFLLSPPS